MPPKTPTEAEIEDKLHALVDRYILTSMSVHTFMDRARALRAQLRMVVDPKKVKAARKKPKKEKPRAPRKKKDPGVVPPETPYWTPSSFRGEFTCSHGVRHDLHIHECCGARCCLRDDFPLKRKETPSVDSPER